MGKAGNSDELERRFAEADRRLAQMDARLERLEDRLDTLHNLILGGVMTLLAALLTTQLT
jgi:hypothetical protein